MSPKNESASQNYVVAIGASAGGLEALQEFLGHFPTDLNNISIIIAQHLSPTHKSMLVQLLSRGTNMQVIEAVHGSSLSLNKVYITPPDKEISIVGGLIHLKKPAFAAGPKPSVDVLFQSMATEFKSKAIAIVLSGTGSDGAAGVSLIKKAGGFVIVQDPQTGKYDGMPSAAIETGNVDIVLPPDKMGEIIKDYINNPETLLNRVEETAASSSTLDKIFKLLSKRTGTDFSNYKPSTICRRLEKRLNMLQLTSIEDYLPIVEKNPKELDIMFNMILIGVTAFFRDLAAFEALEKQLAQIIENKGNKAPIRIWIPGCSTGEEAYSVAILLSKLLKEKTLLHNIQIFATDIDDRAIAFARRALYPETSLEEVPKEIIDTFFIKKGREYELVKSIRMMVLFSKHDVTKNPPFLKLDLICCRNLLIYFGANLQKQVLPIFHYALNPNGYLFLGKSETIGQFSDLFAVIDDKLKIYQRKAVGNIHGIKFSAFKTQRQNLPESTTKLIKPSVKVENSLSNWVKETLFTNFAYPYVIINDAFDIQEINGDVRLYLTFSAGLVNVNLLRMVNKELHIELRSVITKAVKDQTIVKSSIKKFDLFGSTHYVRISCLPLYYKEGVDDLYLVIFEPLDLSDLVIKTPGSSPSERDEQNEKLQELEHELAATKEHLQTYIEELETSNEELQSLNEEMQSTNEELQSANEELETSNEELQSTNEEIQIAYAELKTANALLEKKEKQLQENEANLNAMLSNDLQAFILIDKTYNIVSFNNKAKETFFELTRKRLKKGVSFIDYLDLSLLEQFLTDFKNSIKGSAITREVSIKSIALHTRSYLFNFTPVVYNQDGISAISLGVLEITALKETLFKLSEAQELITSVFDATSIGICITDSSGSFVNMNNQYCQLYGYQKSELLGKSFTLVVPKENRTYAQKLHDDFIQTGMELPGEWIVQKKDGSFMEIFVTAELLVQKDGSRFKVTSIRDITEQNKYKNLLIQTQKSGKIGGWEIELATGKAFWTEEMYKILDESVEAVLNEDSLYHYFEANDAEELKILLDTAKETGNEFSVNYNITTAKGIQKDLHITCKAININNTQVKLFGTLQDITEQKSTEENYRKLFMAAEQSPSSIVITNLKGEIEFVNPAFYTISGYKKHEVIGQNPRFLKSGYTTDVEYKQMWDTISNGKPWSGIFCNKKKSGEFYWESANISPVFNKAGVITHYLAVKENITHQKIAEKDKSIIYQIINTLNDSNNLKQALSDVLKLVYKNFRFLVAECWMVNIDSSKLLRQALINTNEFNKEQSDIADYPTIILNNDTGVISTLFHEKKRKHLIQSEFNLINPNLSHSVSNALYIPVQYQEKVIAVFAFYNDVIYNESEINSEFIKMLESEIGGYLDKKKKEEELNEFFSLAPDMLCIAGFDGYFKKVNPAFEKILGYTEEELLSIPYSNFIVKEDKELTNEVEVQISNGRRVQNFINRYKTKSGEVKWLSWSSTSIDNELMYGVATDITAEYKLTEERKALIAELLRSNQELKQFSYITSHNMRSPITNMLSIFQLLDIEKVPEPETRELLTALKSTTNHLNDTLNDLIKILIIKEDKDLDVKPLSFQAVYQNVMKTINNMVAHAKITTNFIEAPLVYFNEGYLESIFLNLITNSIKYAYPDRIPEINIESKENEGKIVLTFCDNGIGMNMDRVKTKIFGLHQRFHTKTNSTGIGLYIVKSQLETLGGTIDFWSEEDKGTCFTITFKN